MKCYICETTGTVGGTRYGVADAVGVCHNCGIGVCIEHSQKSLETGAPLLCPTCAKVHKVDTIQPKRELSREFA